MISIKKGIDLPIPGMVEDPAIHEFKPHANVAILGEDYQGLKPTMLVAQGDSVKKGQALFEDKKNPGVVICSPVSGVVDSIERGERRRLLSVIIKPEGDEAVRFEPMSPESVREIDPEQARKRLVETGLWAALRTRPFSKIPAIDSKPFAIFVNLMDSNPLAMNPTLALDGRDAEFRAGLSVLGKLTDGNIHVVHRVNARVPATSDANVDYHSFAGIHPAGLVGTHIHFIEPVGPGKTVWYLDLQDLLAFGHLFLHGEIDNTRLISVAGPGVRRPRYVKTMKGVSLAALLEGNLNDGEQRIISGSVFAGRQTSLQTNYLGAYDRQVVVLPEGRESVFLEFVRPGANSYSRTRAYLGRFLNKTLPFTTAVQGSPRPIVPFGIYEEVMPLDILPTLLLKALVIKDTDSGVQLGALELDEEDIALLTYVDPGKHDFGAILRENLTQIEEEG